MYPEAVYYEPAALDYALGADLRVKYAGREWIPITSHNSIEEMQKRRNSEFAAMKQFLIVGVRKTHKYVENHKVSDFLVPYTSSGCSAMCLYCYLVCNYNKCAYLRVFVNREQMMDRLVRTSVKSPVPLTFELGSNSDLVLENAITGNLPWTIEEFARRGKGRITFPTKFRMVDGLLGLEHKGKTIFRMSVNPAELIRSVELETSPLPDRLDALNKMNAAGYPTGLLLAPIILTEDWRALYGELIGTLRDALTDRVKQTTFIEIIFMTYSYVQNAINTEAFPDAAPLFDRERQTGRGKGKYCYREPLRAEAELFLRDRLARDLPEMKILYIV